MQSNDATGERRLARARLTDDRRAGFWVHVEADVEKNAFAAIGRVDAANLEDRFAGFEDHGWRGRPARVWLVLDFGGPDAAHVTIADPHRWRFDERAVPQRVRTSWRERATLRTTAGTRGLAVDPGEHLGALG